MQTGSFSRTRRRRRRSSGTLEIARPAAPPFSDCGKRIRRGRERWLAEMVAAVPPSTWSEEMGRSPAELVTVALESDWKEALLVGWGFAALRHRDAAWAEALLRAWVLEPEGMLQARQVPAWMQ